MDKIEHKLPEGNSWIIKYKLPAELKCNDTIFKELIDMKPTIKSKVIVFGKEYDIPRWQQSYGKDYKFSGVTHKGIELKNDYIKKLLEFVNNDSKYIYTEILVNWYMNGTEYISDHSDDERELEKNSVIYSITFGATRDFVIVSKKDKKYKLVIPLEHNDVVLMGGEMQKYYKHGVPKRLKVKEPRVNITFRRHK